MGVLPGSRARARSEAGVDGVIRSWHVVRLPGAQPAAEGDSRRPVTKPDLVPHLVLPPRGDGGGYPHQFSPNHEAEDVMPRLARGEAGGDVAADHRPQRAGCQADGGEVIGRQFSLNVLVWIQPHQRHVSGDDQYADGGPAQKNGKDATNHAVA